MGRTKMKDVAQKHLRNVKNAAQRLEEARAAFRDALVEAYDSGETYRDIAKWAGISHQRVAQIVRERPRPQNAS